MDPDTQMCREPLVFMARDVSNANDGYALYREYAQGSGLGAQWVAWSPDEACPQETLTTTDEMAPVDTTAWCQLSELPDTVPGCGDTGTDMAQAPLKEAGLHQDLRICPGETDIWAYTGSGTVKFGVKALPGMGDLDLVLTDRDGEFFGGSFGRLADEEVSINLGDVTTTIIINVYLSNENASRDYELRIEPAPTPAVNSSEDGELPNGP